jgi:hypothetical protein
MGKSKKPHHVDSPCRGCAERKLGCHSDCKKFAEYRIANEESRYHFDEYDNYKRKYHSERKKKG